MTVSNTTRKITYLGDGVTTVFTFPFKVFETVELEVAVIDSQGNATVQVENADYTAKLGAGETKKKL